MTFFDFSMPTTSSIESEHEDCEQLGNSFTQLSMRLSRIAGRFLWNWMLMDFGPIFMTRKMSCIEFTIFVYEISSCWLRLASINKWRCVNKCVISIRFVRMLMRQLWVNDYIFDNLLFYSFNGTNQIYLKIARCAYSTLEQNNIFCLLFGDV